MAFRPIMGLSNAERALSDTVSKVHGGLGFARDRRVGVSATAASTVFCAAARIHTAHADMLVAAASSTEPTPSTDSPASHFISHCVAQAVRLGHGPQLMACSPISTSSPAVFGLARSIPESCLLHGPSQGSNKRLKADRMSCLCVKSPLQP